jgi:hypothetical protein
MTIPSRFGAKLSGSLSDGMNSGVNLFAVGEVGAGAGADCNAWLCEARKLFS